MEIVTIDFETYYDKDYSLSKLTTEQYVRDPRFEIIGAGIKINKEPAKWYTDPEKILNSIDFNNTAILCHNTFFDGAILSWKFGIKPKLWLDTLSMARPYHNITAGGSLAKLAKLYNIGEKGTEIIKALGKHKKDFTKEELKAYGQYCINDVELTKALFDKLKHGFPVREIIIIDQAIRMYTEPVIEIDKELLTKYLKEVRDYKQKLLKESNLTRDILMSNDKFAAYLMSLGVDPPKKISPRTEKETWALAKTDKGMTDLLEHENERVRIAAAARLGVKSTIEETRTEALIDIADRGRLPVMLHYYGAHTGRFSGGDKLNLQNLPARAGKTIRQALCAPKGYVFVTCDSSQIEARMLAWVAGQDDLVQAFAEGRDVYSEFASEIYGRKITKADKIERFVGKTCVLGLGYGMGANKFRRALEIGQGGIKISLKEDEAKRIVDLYRNKNQKITEFWQKCNLALNHIYQGFHGELHPQITYDYKGIRLPSSFYIQYPALRYVDGKFSYISDARVYEKFKNGEPTNKNTWTYIYGGKVTENIVQALAALVIREQMMLIGQFYKVVLQVHDEIVIVVPEKEVKKAKIIIEEIMSKTPKWADGLPLACESGVGVNYGETK